MDAILLQLLNGLDKGSAYALIALGLTIIFGTLGVVNFAHGALFMLGSFFAVTMQKLLSLEKVTVDPTQTNMFGGPLETRVPYLEEMFGSFGTLLADYSIFISAVLVIPFMMLAGYTMERGLIRHFYKRSHADQILVTFGLAIVLQEIIKAIYGANPIPMPAPDSLRGSIDVGSFFGMAEGALIYPIWRLLYFIFSLFVIGGVFVFMQFTTFGMVVRAGMADRETVQLLGININKRFTFMFGLAAAVTGIAGVMYTPTLSPNYHMGMDFLVLCFVVVVVGGMGSLPGAVLAGFLLGILQSFSALNAVKNVFPGIDQIIIYLVAVIILLTRPRGLMGRKGVMED